MRCSDREQDILLLHHGALSPFRRARLEAHLRGCPHCREQRERFSAVSGLIAGAIRSGDLPAWQPAAAGRAPEYSSRGVRLGRLVTRPALVLSLAFLIATMSIAAMVWSVRSTTDQYGFSRPATNLQAAGPCVLPPPCAGKAGAASKPGSAASQASSPKKGAKGVPTPSPLPPCR